VPQAKRFDYLFATLAVAEDGRAAAVYWARTQYEGPRGPRGHPLLIVDFETSFYIL
jgi:hypothetical protein